MRLRGKKNRVSLESQTDLVVLEPKKLKGKWHELFGNDNPIHIELGMGKGQFISRMSANHPHINYLGMDMFDELLRIGSRKARTLWKEEKNSDEVPNLFLVRGNVEHLEEMFEPGELERIYLNFSDPWPKSKHAKRRLTYHRFLSMYKNVLNERGEIHFKTDSLSLFEFSLNSFSDSQLQMKNISLDLHRNGLREDLVLTEYETKFSGQGMPIYRLEAVIGSEAIREHRSRVAEAMEKSKRRAPDEDAAEKDEPVTEASSEE
ncbi:tRNA (guanosine(46)-N7)-methyltransferase TrmB [Cohnella thailandensis]|uniref:tRNA (guanine-N(7)-)-methyltransferase n=1 Tax=Cohnella thailandensis TaxID=557557 RepID=A0A841SMD0_9BACL|nr:tRNA (guanosine(46)-N7)-methyltransferase TrmB [Cohnella thailandensis]MBB6633633.1 tRNA (guanosine(46)-N7)-methyltransferase TrmB [Cohnella thailandensis]MBP1976418.1 tRNA (guanine-N7-)-methyltransferase [Cohnella thailandensis]